MLIKILNCFYWGILGIAVFGFIWRVYDAFVTQATIKDGKKIVQLPWDMELHIKLDDAERQVRKPRRK